MQSRILLGRLLTRSGDQAWDFVVPLVLLKLYPDQIRVAAIFFLLTKLSNVVALPRLASLIDRMNRMNAARSGVVLQLVGVLAGAAAIYFLLIAKGIDSTRPSPLPIVALVVLVLGGVLSSLGSTFMDISIANDLVPASLAPDELTKFNSRLRQTDLFTEVTSPVIAGLLLLLDEPALIGFFLVAAWNVVSFFPELGLIHSVLRQRPELMSKTARVPERAKISLFEKLTGGWKAFFKEPVALVAIAYAFLWLSVLSPHGVLLAGFLKDEWRLPEWAIGVFRGSGAFFGLLATALFPWAERRWGLLNGTRNFIVYQAFTLSLALGFFFFEGVTGQLGFLVFILFSRIGLYGFSLGEMQIRQIGIAPVVRGEVNGFANALTSVATLGLYGAGALLPATSDFRILIIGSVVMVGIGCLVYVVWLSSRHASKIGELEKSLK